MNLQDFDIWKKTIVKRQLTKKQLEYGDKKLQKNIRNMNMKIEWLKKDIENLYFYMVDKSYSENMNKYARLLRHELGLEINKIEDARREQWKRIYFIEELIQQSTKQ
jgi:hypothetical protein